MATVEVMAIQDSALVRVEKMTAEMLFSPGVIDPLLDQIKAEVRSVVPDLTNDKGRRAVASLAYKVARTKTFIDEGRQKLVAEEKKRLAAIDAEGKRIRDELDALKDEVRQPLTAWEAAESERVTAHQNAIAFIEQQSVAEHAFDTSARVKNRIDAVNQIFEREWHEFLAQAAEVKDRVLTSLHASLEITKQREAEAAELAKLRQEKAEREEAERKAREREATLQREIEAAEAKRIQNHQFNLGNLRAFIDFAALPNTSASAIEQRIIYLQDNDRDWQEFAAEAATVKAQAIAALESALEAVRERERIAADQAAEAERARIAEKERRQLQQMREAEEEKQRALEANKRHRAKVHREIAAAFQEFAGFSEDQAKAAAVQIAAGKIPHVEVRY